MAPRRWISARQHSSFIAVRLGLLMALLAASAMAQSRPNILLIVADDMGTDKVAAYGEHPTPGNTPTLDWLASEGVLFRNAWSHDVCSSTRAGLLTGRHPFRHGIGTWLDHTGGTFDISVDEVSLADVVSAEGYRSALIGKWHLSSYATAGNPLLAPLELGFEHHWGPLSNLPNEAGPQAYFNYDKNVDGTLVSSRTYATTEQVDDALAAIASFGSDPWFVWLAFSAPHKPLHAPPADLHSYNLVIEGPIQAMRGQPALQAGAAPSPGLATGMGGAPGGAPGPLPGTTSVKHTPILGNEASFVKASIEAMDTEIGRLLSSLPPAELADTLIIFVGDNGTEPIGVQPPWDPTHGKSSMFEGGINVPLIVRGPGVAAGQETSVLVHSTDLFATIAEAAGGDGGAGLDSLSLVPWLTNPGQPPSRPWVYNERFRPNGLVGVPVFEERVARDGRYKLIRRFVNGVLSKDFVYDLQTDPFELKDLAAPVPLDPVALQHYLSLLAVIAAAHP